MSLAQKSFVKSSKSRLALKLWLWLLLWVKQGLSSKILELRVGRSTEQVHVKLIRLGELTAGVEGGG